MERPLVIAVIGEGDPAPEMLRAAEAVGSEIAAAGAMLTCGGLAASWSPPAATSCDIQAS